MKKTYIKITSLILVLIFAVMFLGAALFTYIQISRVNSDYLADIHSTHQLPSYNYDINSEPAEQYMISHMSTKYLPTLSSKGLGYYGVIDWRWIASNEAHHIESTDYKRTAISLVNKDQESTTLILGEGSYLFVPGEDDGSSDAVIYNNDKSEWKVTVIYAKDFNKRNTDGKGTNFILGFDNKNVSEQDIAKLDKEAKVKYAEIKGSLNPDMTRTGWLTSYVVYASDSTVADGQIMVKECDVYVFHPLELVVKSFSYVYILFFNLIMVNSLKLLLIEENMIQN